MIQICLFHSRKPDGWPLSSAVVLSLTADFKMRFYPAALTACA